MNTRRRIAALDEIRGFCIVCMVFYHAFYLFGTQLNRDFSMQLFHFFEPAQLVFASVFILISGVCTRLSRNVLRRGAMLFAIALAISGITVYLLPRIGYDSFQDRFGILHLLSVSMLLTAILKKPLDSIPPSVGVMLCVGLYLLTKVLTDTVDLKSPYLFPFGWTTKTFYSADYFPVLPHLFMFWLGVFAGRSFLSRDLPESEYRMHVRSFAFLGRHSLAIYLLHTPLLLGIIYLLERI